MVQDTGTMLFLGAGASVPFEKPTTVTVRKRLLEKYTGKARGREGAPEGMLQSFLANQRFADIEDVLQSLNEWSSIGETLPHAVLYLEGNDSRINHVTLNNRYSFDIGEFLNQVADARRFLEDDVFEIYRWDHPQEKKLMDIYKHIFNVLESTHRNGIHVATTNYDKAVERFCYLSKDRYRLLNGFSYNSDLGMPVWSNWQYDEPKKGGDVREDVYLYKIHGSLDWKRHRMKEYGIVKTGEESRSGDPNYVQNLVIFPTVSPKEDAEQEPYASILKRFSTVANNASSMIIIGYSFRDHNINEVLKDFIDEGGRSVVVVSPSATKNLATNLFGMDKLDEQSIKYRIPENLLAIDKGIGTDTAEQIALQAYAFIHRPA